MIYFKIFININERKKKRNLLKKTILLTKIIYFLLYLY